MLLVLLLVLQTLTPSSPSDTTHAREAERDRMVRTQIAARGIEDPDVLAALRAVPRHRFMPERWRPYAYEDRPLPIGHEQTISQPFIVAYMTELLRLRPDDVVLEVGTGSGYQAAVLAEIVDRVYSIELIPDLARTAARRLQRLGYDGVTVRQGDGYLGWPKYAPFDAIIVTAAPGHIPPPLIDQLAEGGRLVIPVGRTASTQTLMLVEKKDGEVTRRRLAPVRFVPLRRSH